MMDTDMTTWRSGCSGLQATREALFVTLKLQGEIRNVLRKHFYLTPMLLLYLGEDQMAYDYIYRFLLFNKQKKSIENCCRLLPLSSDLGRDRSMGLNFRQIESNKGMFFYHYVSYLMIKMRYLHHLINVEGLYTFVHAVQQQQQSDLPVNRLAGHQEVLHVIKSYLLDVKNLPTSQFVIRDPSNIRRQIQVALRAGDEEHYGNIWHKLLIGCRNHRVEISKLRESKGTYKKQSTLRDEMITKNPSLSLFSGPLEYYEDDDCFDMSEDFDVDSDEEEEEEEVLEAQSERNKRLMQDVAHALLLQSEGAPLLQEIRNYVNSRG
jgi:hypothetical protein